jgi:ABC-type multidrug transport system ATPase subunit
METVEVLISFFYSSMDETEALCTQIGIMVNGELKCLGNLQHLKNKYGDGYTLILKLLLSDTANNDDRIEGFIKFMLSKLNNSYLKESREGFINIQINDSSIKVLASVFSLVEEVKAKYQIEYYVVTQTKLEQIFLNFASKQIDPESRYLTKANIFKYISDYICKRPDSSESTENSE